MPVDRERPQPYTKNRQLRKDGNERGVCIEQVIFRSIYEYTYIYMHAITIGWGHESKESRER